MAKGENVFRVYYIFTSFNDTFVHVTDPSGKKEKQTKKNHVLCDWWDEGKGCPGESSTHAATLATRMWPKGARSQALLPYIKPSNSRPQKEIELRSLDLGPAQV